MVDGIFYEEILIGSIAAAGAASVIITYFLFRDLWSLRYMELVFYVSLNDMLGSIGIALGPAPSGSAACWFQGIFTNFNYLASVFWTTVITYQVWLVVSQCKVLEDMTLIHVICWGVPLLFTLLPLTTNTYGNTQSNFDGDWCYIDVRKGSPSWGLVVWTFLAFYAWVFIALLKLQWYPIITILCWVPAGVLDFYIIMTKEDSGSLRDLNMVVVALAISQGLFNSVVFFTMNPQVRHKWWVLLSTGKFSVALPVAGTANSSDVSRQSEQAEPVEAQYDYRPSSLLKKSKDTRESELPMYLGKPSQGDTSFSAAAASLPGRGGGVGGEVVSPIQEFREDSAAGWNCF